VVPRTPVKAHVFIPVPAALTLREQDVVEQFLKYPESDKVLAHNLNIKYATFKQRSSRVFHKLGIDGRGSRGRLVLLHMKMAQQRAEIDQLKRAGLTEEVVSLPSHVNPLRRLIQPIARDFSNLLAVIALSIESQSLEFPGNSLIADIQAAHAMAVTLTERLFKLLET